MRWLAVAGVLLGAFTLVVVCALALIERAGREELRGR